MSADAALAPTPGMTLIATYRAARLDQRATFHTGPLVARARPDMPEAGRAADTEPAVADGGDDPPAVHDDPRVPAASNVDRPLAESGFGPGMLIRLGQLGLHTAGDLAQADVAQLRAALGDISRLVDVEGWIQNARRDCAMA
jgi:hypothetical protein